MTQFPITEANDSALAVDPTMILGWLNSAASSSPISEICHHSISFSVSQVAILQELCLQKFCMHGLHSHSNKIPSLLQFPWLDKFFAHVIIQETSRHLWSRKVHYPVPTRDSHRNLS
jgi:hypothetical protein